MHSTLPRPVGSWLPKLLLLLLALGLGSPARASHLVGGELTYRYLDASGPSTAPLRYELTVTIYNNCDGTGIAPRAAAYVGIYDQATGTRYQLTAVNYAYTGTLVGVSGLLAIPETSRSSCITPVIPSGCTVTGPVQPYILQKFTAVVNLPANPAGYYAVFTDASRNVDIANLDDPGEKNLELYTAMQPPVVPNRSPVFSDVAVAVICANDTSLLLNGAVDPDGDRLAYSFGQPYGASSPQPAMPTSFVPPPALVSYQSGYGYSAASPFGTGTGTVASLDANTGVARYSTPTLGKYVVAVDVQEYRTINGVERLIGTTRRDLQLVVASCPNIKAPVLPTAAVTPRSYTIEAGSTLTVPITVTQRDNHPLQMTFNSELFDGAGGHNATLNGDQGTLASGGFTGTVTTTGANGTATGTLVFAAACGEARPAPYSIALSVQDLGCAGKTVYGVYNITVTKPAGPKAVAGDATVCGLNTTHSYTASGGSAPGTSWRVVGGTIVGSATANPVQVQWTTAGSYLVVARGLSQYGCLTDSVRYAVTVQPLPAANVGQATRTACAGTTLVLGAAPVAGNTYAWTPATGLSSATVANPTLTLTNTTGSPLTQTYTLTETGPTGCTTRNAVAVTVNPAVTANPGPAVALCQGATAQLGAASVAGFSYAWTPATGLSSPTAANPTITLTNTTGAATTQTYTLTTTNTATGCAGTATVAVTVNPLVAANPGVPISICPGSQGQLGAAPVAGFSYAWTPATGLSSATAANPTVTLPNTGTTPLTQTYSLTTTNTATGCAGTATVVVTVSPPPTAQPGAAIAICAGQPGQLGAAPTSGYSYSWSPATGLSSPTAANPTVTLPNSGSAATTQTYTLTTTNAIGCVATGTVAVTVNPLPVAQPGADVSACTGQPVQLGAAPVPNYTYAWTPATGLSSATVANPTLTLANTTGAVLVQTYTLTTTNPATGCTSTGRVTVSVNVPVMGGSIGADQMVCAGTVPAALTNVSSGTTSFGYQWESSPDNTTWTVVPGAANATYAPPALTATTYYRRRATLGSCGTAVSNVVTLTVTQPLQAAVALAQPPQQCAGLPFTFVPVPTNAGPAPTYAWYVNNAPVATTATYTSTTLADGDAVRVELTPTAGFCAVGPASAAVTIHLTPSPVPTVSVVAQQTRPVCTGATLAFGVSTTNLGATATYQWQVDGVPMAGATGSSFSSTQLRNGQLVAVVLRTTTPCGPVAITSAAAQALVVAPVQVSAGPDKDIMEGEEVTLEATAGGTYRLSWLPAAGLTFAAGDTLHPRAAPLATTTYVLSARAGDCTGRDSVTVVVHPRVRIPTAFSPNGDGQDDTWEIDHLGDYPANKVLVFNRWGNKVFEGDGYTHGTEWNGTIGGQPAPVGTYYYVITLGNGRKFSGPITVVY